MKRGIGIALTGLLCCAMQLVQAAQPGVPRFHQYSDSLASSGQPAQTQFDEIELAGYTLVINLAPPNYPGALANERQLVEAARMKYVHIPVDWDRPSLSSLVQFFEVMAQNRNNKVLVHCWVNSRASAFVYLYRTLRERAPEQPELEVLTRLWNLNRGYELQNAPQWRAFIEQAKQQVRD
jgi:protein tyrosine phosphatase (PTP) superfamily phosphohydrolase (DUF442 family)